MASEGPMHPDHLTPEARAENAAMLATALGLNVSEAGEALSFDVAVTVDPKDPVASAIANEFVQIFERTVRSVKLNGDYSASCLEVVIGNAPPRTGHKKLFVSVSEERATIGDGQIEMCCTQMPHIFSVLVACYTCAAALQRALDGRLPFNVAPQLVIPFDQFGIDEEAFTAPIYIEKAYLAGAGAIGNGFIWAARYLDVHGEIHIADDDTVSPGNLNRQIWFTKEDIDKPKADRLASHAQPFFPNLTLIPRRKRLQDLRSEGPWLKRLIVAVDSRRARREIQNEFPGEVFDASTTDIREVVVHYHKQVTERACLSCIYEADPDEASREAHIAEHLGVSVEEVRQERISEHAAKRIAARIPKLDGRAIVGVAYDTLFKQLCGEGELKTLEGRRVIAPFAFVSVLAGALLVLEVVRRLGKGVSGRNHNYWRVSPWHPPIQRRQQLRPKQPGCEFCSDSILARVNTALWGNQDRPGVPVLGQ